MSARVISDNQARSSIEQGLQRVADSAEEQLTALEKCLELIDTHLRPGGPGWVPQNDGEWWWALRRLETLQHYDRVATTLKLCQGSFNAQLYTELRNANILHVAQSAASCGNISALSILLDLHPYALAPNILETLNSAPETLAAKKLEPVLRQIVALRGEPPTLPRASDWVELDSVYTLLRRQHAQTSNYNNNSVVAPTATENLVRAGTPWSPPTEAQIASWARRRAASIDKLTGQLPAAMELLESTRAALHYGPESQPIADLHRAAQQLLLIIKLAAARSEAGNDGTNSSSSDEDEQQEEDLQGVNSANQDQTLSPKVAAWRMDLSIFATHDDVGRLQILFHLIENDDLAYDIPHVILPFLNQLSSETTPIGRTLRRALEAEASTRLSWVVSFIQLESQRPSIFETAGDLASAACAAAYACPSVEAWSLQEKLLHAAVEAIESDTAAAPDEWQALLSTVTQVQGHLTAARVLTKHGLSTPLSTVRDATREDILTMVRTLLARVARAKPAESRWVDLWTDLKAAQSSGLQALPLENVRAEMCKALLRCNQLRPAQKHLASLEDASLREELVLDAARDAVYSEENPDDATVRRALDVLKTLPDSKAALEEASFIHAAAKLRALGIEMPPLQLRQQPDKATLLQKAISAAPVKALKDVDGLLELSKSLKTGLKKAQVLSLIAEAALVLRQPRLAADVVKQLANEGSSDGWQIAARVAMEEPCSSEAERRRLLAYAMRFAPAEELEGQLHCWQESDAGAAGDAEIWSVPEKTSSETPSSSGVQDTVPTSCIQPLKEALDTFLLVGSSSAEDGLLAFSCLNTLGFEGQKQWAESVHTHRGGLDPPALRQAYIVGIASASILALASTLQKQQTLPEEPSTPSETTTDTGEEKLSAPLDSSTNTSLYSDLLSLSPQELLSSFLRLVTSSTGDADKANKGSSDVEYLKILILDFCQQLVSCSDAQRVARLLPGGHSAETWMEGGVEAQRSVVLQLAATAGRGEKHSKNSRLGLGESDAVEEEENDEEEERKEEGEEEEKELSSFASGHQASLQQALSLAERCGVDAWEVQLAYAIAVLTRFVHCSQRTKKKIGKDASAASVFQAAAENDLAPVWSSLLESRPKETLSALLSQVYLQLTSTPHDKNSNTKDNDPESQGGSSDAEVDWLVWVLQLSGECFQHCATTSTNTSTTTSSASEDEYAAASSVVEGLAEGISALHAACCDTEVKTFLNPTMRLLQDLYSQETTAHNTSLEELNRAVIEQLMEHCEYSSVAALAFAVDALARQHALLINNSTTSSSSCPYPATASTVYVVTLCKELSAMSMTEGVDLEQKSKLETLFSGADAADCIATASFVCLNGPPPIHFPLEPISVFLSPQQSLTVLECALAALAGNEISGAPASVDTFSSLQKERVRLAALLQIESTCREDLFEHHVKDLQTLIPQLLKENASSTSEQQQQEENFTLEKVALLMRALSRLFSDGCKVNAITNIAEACKEIGSWVVKAVDEEDLVLKAAENAVNCALGALQGSGSSSASASGLIDTQKEGEDLQEQQQSLSVGDAVQNLYGVIRSLDISASSTLTEDEAQAESQGQGQGQTHLLESIRSKVWTMLQTHAAEHSSNTTDAAAAEAHLQVLEILGSLGSSMWHGWQPPLGAMAFSTTGGATYKHAEALLHSRAAAALAAPWPSALREASIIPEDFSSLETTEASLMKLLDIATTVQQLSAVVVLLPEVLHGTVFPVSHEDIQTTPDDDANVASNSIGKDGDGGATLLDPLHRVWARCLTAFLTQGELNTVITALDAALVAFPSSTHDVVEDVGRGDAVVKFLVNEIEAEGLVTAADATFGTVAAASVALLTPYKRIQNKEWAKILSLQSGDDVQGLPGLTSLAVVAVYQKGLLVDLANRNPGVFRQLCRALLQRDDVALFAVPRGSQMIHQLPPRTGLAVDIAAQLVLGSSNSGGGGGSGSGNLSAAAWVAMLHAGTHPFLRILDSGSTVLIGLLRAGVKLKWKQPGIAEEEIELEPAVRAVLGTAKCAERILKRMPMEAAAALEQLEQQK